MKKSTFWVGVHSKYVTMDSLYQVHWGKPGSAYNRNTRRFRKKSAAIKYAKNLVKKYSQRYKVKYAYLND